jgi:hypothetical protein
MRDGSSGSTHRLLGRSLYQVRYATDENGRPIGRPFRISEHAGAGYGVIVPVRLPIM